MTRTIQFTKMHGAGNDYIYINAIKYPIADPEMERIPHGNRKRRTCID